MTTSARVVLFLLLSVAAVCAQDPPKLDPRDVQIQEQEKLIKALQDQVNKAPAPAAKLTPEEEAARMLKTMMSVYAGSKTSIGAKACKDGKGKYYGVVYINGLPAPMCIFDF